DPLSARRPGLGRPHRLGPGAGQELAADGLRLAGAVHGPGRRPRLAVDPQQHRPLGRTGRQARPSAGCRPRRRRLHAKRSANRLVSRPLCPDGPRSAGRSDHRAAELAAGLRLHHHLGFPGAQRLRSRQRPLRQARQTADRDRRLERDPRLALELPGGVGRAPLPRRRARRQHPLDRDPHHRDPDADLRRRAPQEPARHLRHRHQLVEGAGTMTPPISKEAGGPASRFSAIQQSREGANAVFRKAGLTALLMSVSALGGCAHNFIPPDINYDSAAPAKLTVDPPAPIKIVELPKPLPLPGQLKPIDGGKPTPEAADPTVRVNQANAAARIQPVRNGVINAVQVYPFSGGALYQVYTAPGEITDIALQDGEQLVGSGPVAAGDTVRWIIGDTESGAGATKKVHILVKPTRPELLTNLVINTDRRTYLLELRSTEKTYMASVSWQYPEDQLIALRRQNQEADAAAPIATGVDLASINFRYAIQGDNPAWRPLRAFDDGKKVYIEFPSGIAQGEMPPLFVIGPAGGSELVNYRVNRNYYIVDRLFAAAELRLGDKDSERRVRIIRTDGRPRS